jgi:hypothetical protein
MTPSYVDLNKYLKSIWILKYSDWKRLSKLPSDFLGAFLDPLGFLPSYSNVLSSTSSALFVEVPRLGIWLPGIGDLSIPLG